jgi:hypothetical protein
MCTAGACYNSIYCRTNKTAAVTALLLLTKGNTFSVLLMVSTKVLHHALCVDNITAIGLPLLRRHSATHTQAPPPTTLPITSSSSMPLCAAAVARAPFGGLTSACSTLYSDLHEGAICCCKELCEHVASAVTCAASKEA